MPLLWYLFCCCVIVVDLSKAQSCTASNKTSFLKSDGYQLQSNSDALSIPGISLTACSAYCANNTDQRNQPKNCNSFQYTSKSSTCQLSSISGQPYGQGVLTATTESSFYQKICLQSNQLCDSAYSFERVPQHVLVGFALEVVKVRTASECLVMCLEANQKFNTDCKSVMYYYDTNECLINREDRKNRPDLFSTDTQGYIVDYFENNCAGGAGQCDNVQQFIKVAGAELQNRRDVTVSNADLTSCQHLCVSNQNGKGEPFACKAVMYESSSRNCYLSSEKSPPQGKQKLLDNPNVDFYEKTCFNGPQTCGGESAFTRTPQHVLVGYATEVTQAVTVNDCLDQCLSATKKSAFNCKSVMYYYDTSECILNGQDKKSVPELFTADTQGLSVDYFENNCYDNPSTCPKGDTRVYIKAPGLKLPVSDISSSSNNNSIANYLGNSPPPANTLSACLTKCTAETRFTCRSVDYSEQTCVTSYQNSDGLGLLTAANPPTDYFESRCLTGAPGNCASLLYAFLYYPDQTLSNGVAKTINSISSDVCLSMCLQENCPSVNYNRLKSACELNQNSARSLGGISSLKPAAGTDYFENVCANAALKNCQYQKAADSKRQVGIYRLSSSKADLNGCQQNCDAERTFVCQSIAVSSSTQECFLSDMDTKLIPIGQLLESAPGLDYYEKVCQGGSTNNPYRPNFSPTAGPNARPNGLTPGVNTDCRYDGVRIKVSFNSATTGAIFPKNKFATCGNEFRNVDFVVLDIAFPNSTSSGQKDCDGVQIGRNKYSYMIVVQTNPYGIPGLMTDQDQVYNVTCDYVDQPVQYASGSVGATVAANAPVTMFAQGKFDMTPNIVIDLERRGNAADSVLLGETIDLKWKIISEVPDLDFFIRSCAAERVGGPLPKPTPLQLITDGCPDPSIEGRIITGPIVKTAKSSFAVPMKVFRFDGSKSVKIHCQIDMCHNECYPTTCVVQNSKIASFGRRKRANFEALPTGNEQRRIFTGRDNVTLRLFGAGGTTPYSPLTTITNTVVNNREVSRVFTIVDSLPEIETSPDTSNKPKSNQKGLATDSDDVRVTPKKFMMKDGKVCVIKSVFVGIFTFLGLLSVTEALVVGWYIWRKFIRPRRPKSTEVVDLSSNGPVRHLRPSMIDNIHYSFAESSAKTASLLSSSDGSGSKLVKSHLRPFEFGPSTSSSSQQQHWPTATIDSSEISTGSCLITGQLKAVPVASDTTSLERPSDMLIKSVRQHLVKRRPQQQLTYQYFSALPAICDTPTNDRTNTTRSDNRSTNSYPSTIDFDPNAKDSLSGLTYHRSLAATNATDKRSANKTDQSCPVHGKS